MPTPKSYLQRHKAPRVHRQVWEEAFGKIPDGMHIDHINGDIHDNRLENLRCCTPSENIRNSKLSLANTSGLKGLSWDSSRNRWRAAIKLYGKQYSIRSEDLLEACCWLFSTRREVHGEFARNR